MNHPLPPTWKTRETQNSDTERIAKHFQLRIEVAALFVNRGLTDLSQIEAFLNPQFNALIHPKAMHGLDAAIDRIIQAIEKKERVLIHGDYDIDGITSTALLYRFFSHLLMQPLVYIPNRLHESHGINAAGIKYAVDNKVNLVVTCDCGISCDTQITELHQQGIETIVTDHHLVPEQGPPQHAIVVNPSQEVCEFGDEGMAGVGIAYYLVIALRSRLRDMGFFNDAIEEPNLKHYLDLVALGTIGDQAPLVGQNRILVRSGLEALATTSKRGLQVLLNLNVSADRNPTVHDVAFGLAPKINAAGRLGQADQAFELLVEEDPVRAAVLARKLINLNDERRAVLDQVHFEAAHQLKRVAKNGLPHGIVLSNPNWHIGVLGIAAQKMVEATGRPSILLTQQGDLFKGSGRSIRGLHIVQLLDQCRDLLTSYGGHEMACGMALAADQVDAFKARFAEVTQARGLPKDANHVYIDGCISLGQIDEVLIEQMNLLRPYGQGNPEPIFACLDLKVKQARSMGDKDQHIRAMLRDPQGCELQVVGFGLGEYIRKTDEAWSVLLTPEINVWRGRRSLQGRLHAIWTPSLSKK